MADYREVTIPDASVRVFPDGQIEVREDTVLYRDDEEVARTTHRYTLCPGDDLSQRDTSVSAIANLKWTPDVVSAFQAARQAQMDGGGVSE